MDRKRKGKTSGERLRQPIAILTVMALILLAAIPCGADESEKVGQDDKYPWHVTAFWGAAFQEKLRDLFTFQARFEDDTYVAGMALSRDIWHYKDWLAIELEGQVAKHYGEQADQWEFVGVFVFRYLKFPWNKYVPTTVAFGEGLSYYTELSELELDDSEDATKLTNYLLLELTVGYPSLPQWDLSVRVHHRSGIYGLISNAGSNYLCGALRYSF
jgi:hypothetical protein